MSVLNFVSKEEKETLKNLEDAKKKLKNAILDQEYLRAYIQKLEGKLKR